MPQQVATVPSQQFQIAIRCVESSLGLGSRGYAPPCRLTQADDAAVASADMTVKMESRLEAWANNRNPSDTTAIGQHLRTITRTDSVINVDTSANVRSTRDAIHVSIDLDVRIKRLPHHQRRWVESFKRELL